MEMQMTYISYVIQTDKGPVFDHEKFHLEHTMSAGTFHDVTKTEVVKWADRKMKELPKGQRLTVLNFFTYENEK